MSVKLFIPLTPLSLSTDCGASPTLSVPPIAPAQTATLICGQIDGTVSHETNRLLGCHDRNHTRSSRLLGGLFAGLAVFAAVAVATITACAGEAAAPAAPPPPMAPAIYEKGRWEFSLESAYTFQTMRNPFFALAGVDNSNPLHYRLATQILSARYQLTNVAGPWFLRGTLEGSTNIVGSAIVHGPESYFIGFALGLRYYFVQPGARFVPYVEVRGGPGQTDSRGFHYAQQQDLCFTYLLGAGLRYDVDKNWSVTLSVLDQHISDAYLTHPNYGFDSMGVSLGIVRRF